VPNEKGLRFERHVAVPAVRGGGDCGSGGDVCDGSGGGGGDCVMVVIV
jgi:hypothetical protein